MYKVTIEKDGKVIHTEDNMTVVMLTGNQADGLPQIIEGEASPETMLGLLELFKQAIFEEL